MMSSSLVATSLTDEERRQIQEEAEFLAELKAAALFQQQELKWQDELRGMFEQTQRLEEELAKSSPLPATMQQQPRFEDYNNYFDSNQNNNYNRNQQVNSSYQQQQQQNYYEEERASQPIIQQHEQNPNQYYNYQQQQEQRPLSSTTNNNRFLNNSNFYR